MENKPNFNVLETVEKIHNASENSELKLDRLTEVKEEIEQFANYLDVEPTSAVIFASVFVMNDANTMTRIFKHFGGNQYLLFLKNKVYVKPLFGKQLLKNPMPLTSNIKRYNIPIYIEDCISENNFLLDEEKRIEKPKTLVDILNAMPTFDGYEDDDVFFDLDNIITATIRDNQHLPFFQQMQEWKLYEYEVFLLMHMLKTAVGAGNNRFNTVIAKTIEGYFGNKSKTLEFLDDVLEGESNLISQNLIEVKKETFKEHTTAKFAPRIVKLLAEKENIQLDYSEENTNLVLPEKIRHKNLFYNRSEIKHIDTLKEVLTDKNFKEVVEKLEEKAMPVGFTILLHGSPGTGKTESVYQIAMETGRKIFKVEISDAKSKWYGESERLVKKIFTDYAKLKNEEELCPILMFNEADALINKRKSNEQYADKTDNAIQNIFLEELENFNGILMATTNLVENLEKAFERRFLYKVRFEKPSIENAAKIWQDKIPFLSEDESLKLAEKFDFSGGEIENVARKCTMTEILHKKNIEFEQVIDFCNEERWSDDGKSKIGF